MDAKKKYLIFIVEDNRMYNRLISGNLENKGFAGIKSFFTGKECIDAIKKSEIPDLIIQDYFLEDMNGYEVMQEVKRINSEIGFIFLTENDDVTVAVNAMKSGAFDYVIKDEKAPAKIVQKVWDTLKMIEQRRKNRQIQLLMRIFIIIVLVILVFSILVFAFDIFHLF